jgi:hypothetical protein
MRCYVMYDPNFIGLSYGVSHQLVGIRAAAYSPVWLGMPLILAPEVTWRIPHQGSSYFNLELTRRELARVGKMFLEPRAGYKRIVSSHRSTDQFYAGLGLSTWVGAVALGYARQYQPAGESNPPNANGIIVNVQGELWGQLKIKTSAICWFNQFQYAVEMREKLFQSDFCISVGYENMAAWSELTVGLQYGR